MGAVYANLFVSCPNMDCLGPGWEVTHDPGEPDLRAAHVVIDLGRPSDVPTDDTCGDCGADLALKMAYPLDRAMLWLTSQSDVERLAYLELRKDGVGDIEARQAVRAALTPVDTD